MNRRGRPRAECCSQKERGEGEVTPGATVKLSPCFHMKVPEIAHQGQINLFLGCRQDRSSNILMKRFENNSPVLWFSRQKA